VDDKPVALEAGDGISYEMKLILDLKKTDAECVELEFRSGEGRAARCTLDLKHAIMQVDRNHSDGWSQGISRSVLYLKGKDELDIHVYADQSSLEIFTSQYQNNHSNNVFAPDEQNQLKIRAIGGKAYIKTYESYGIKECFVS
jgi:beta-fructofuranosidase